MFLTPRGMTPFFAAPWRDPTVLGKNAMKGRTCVGNPFSTWHLRQPKEGIQIGSTIALNSLLFESIVLES